MMKSKVGVVLLVVMILVGFMATQAFAQKQVIKWRLQSAYPLGTTVTMISYEWVKAMDEMTNGRLKAEVLPPGAICAVKDMIDYMGRGVFEAGSTYGAFYTGLIPETDLEIGLPGGHQSIDEVYDAVYQRGLGEIIEAAYGKHGVHWWNYPSDCYYHFMTTFPIKSLDDLKGKKVRALGIYGKYAERLGASPVVVAGAEMYMAMKLGTIDGAIYGASGLKDIKLNEVAKFYVHPTAAQISGNLLIGKKALAKLPEDIRTIVMNGTRAVLYQAAIKYTIQCKESMNWAERMGTTKRFYLSEQDQAKMRKLVKPLWDELAAINPQMKKGVDIMKQQMRDLGRPMD